MKATTNKTEQNKTKQNLHEMQKRNLLETILEAGNKSTSFSQILSSNCALVSQLIMCLTLTDRFTKNLIG